MTSKPCPKCAETMTLSLSEGVFRCPNGHRLIETLDEAQARLRAKGNRPVVAINFRGALDMRARSLFESAHDYLWRGDTDAAIDALRDALDVQPDFIDAHLWMARTVSDTAVRRKHLEMLVAYEPGNLDGIRELMLLDGKLTPEQAERSRSTAAPILQHAEAVKTTTRTLACPVCGGDLTLDAANRLVICKFCGYTAPLPAATDDGAQTMGVALIQQRARGVKWQIGERLQHCNNCGAERTIPQGRLSGACPFCGATAVIIADATDSLEQPDAIVPFRIDEESAKQAVIERLKGIDERLYGLFADNRIASAALEGVYLPFWVFDAVIDVTRTLTAYHPSRRNEGRRITALDSTTHFQDGMIGIPIPAVNAPPARLVSETTPYTFDQAAPYHPNLLAKYPAALYSRDFETAALDARTIAAAATRARHGHSEAHEAEVRVSASVQQMTFRLALMPVWMVSLVERDGDRRLALVNGQTGRVALGTPERTK